MVSVFLFGYLCITVNSPGKAILMVPPYIHCKEHKLVNAGFLPTITFGFPGIQGAGVFGMHGPGVPETLINVGHKGEAHKAKGAIFTKGLLSIIVAIGFFSVLTIAVGITLNVAGAIPIVHVIIAPLAT